MIGRLNGRPGARRRCRRIHSATTLSNQCGILGGLSTIILTRVQRGLFRQRPALLVGWFALVTIAGWSAWTEQDDAAPAIVEKNEIPADNEESEESDVDMLLANYSVTDKSESAIRFANEVGALHTKCSASGHDHHDSAYGDDPVAAVATLTEALNVPMLRCTDLAGVAGRTFESANLCSVIDAHGKAHECGHMIYRWENGEAVSLMSISRLPEVQGLIKRNVDDRNYAILEPNDPSITGPMTVVAFDCPKATHVVCVPFNPADTIRMAKSMTYHQHVSAPVRPVSYALLPH